MMIKTRTKKHLKIHLILSLCIVIECVTETEKKKAELE